MRVKRWYQSKTVWVQIVGFASQVAGFGLVAISGLDISPIAMAFWFVGLNSVQAGATALIRMLDTPAKIVGKKAMEKVSAPLVEDGEPG